MNLMEYGKQLRRSFGRYKCEEVDACLDELKQYAAGQEERADRLERELSELKAKEAAVLQEKAEAEEALRQQSTEQEFLKALQQEYSTLSEENEKLKKQLEIYPADLRTLQTQLEETKQLLSQTREDLELSRSQSDMLAQRLARQRQDLEQMEKLLQLDPVGEASRRADKILREAMDSSQKMIDDAENMRTRALAAVRAAYFNAMGFRQSIEERFVALEHDLDQSLGSLRTIDISDQNQAVKFFPEDK